MYKQQRSLACWFVLAITTVVLLQSVTTFANEMNSCDFTKGEMVLKERLLNQDSEMDSFMKSKVKMSKSKTYAMLNGLRKKVNELSSLGKSLTKTKCTAVLVKEVYRLSAKWKKIYSAKTSTSGRKKCKPTRGERKLRNKMKQHIRLMITHMNVTKSKPVTMGILKYFEIKIDEISGLLKSMKKTRCTAALGNIEKQMEMQYKKLKMSKTSIMNKNSCRPTKKEMGIRNMLKQMNDKLKGVSKSATQSMFEQLEKEIAKLDGLLKPLPKTKCTEILMKRLKQTRTQLNEAMMSKMSVMHKKVCIPTKKEMAIGNMLKQIDGQLKALRTGTGVSKSGMQTMFEELEKEIGKLDGLLKPLPKTQCTEILIKMLNETRKQLNEAKMSKMSVKYKKHCIATEEEMVVKNRQNQLEGQIKAFMSYLNRIGMPKSGTKAMFKVLENEIGKINGLLKPMPRTMCTEILMEMVKETQMQLNEAKMSKTSVMHEKSCTPTKKEMAISYMLKQMNDKLYALMNTRIDESKSGTQALFEELENEIGKVDGLLKSMPKTKCTEILAKIVKETQMQLNETTMSKMSATHKKTCIPSQKERVVRNVLKQMQGEIKAFMSYRYRIGMPKSSMKTMFKILEKEIGKIDGLLKSMPKTKCTEILTKMVKETQMQLNEAKMFKTSVVHEKSCTPTKKEMAISYMLRQVNDKLYALMNTRTDESKSGMQAMFEELENEIGKLHELFKSMPKTKCTEILTKMVEETQIQLKETVMTKMSATHKKTCIPSQKERVIRNMLKQMEGEIKAFMSYRYRIGMPKSGTKTMFKVLEKEIGKIDGLLKSMPRTLCTEILMKMVKETQMQLNETMMSKMSDMYRKRCTPTKKEMLIGDAQERLKMEIYNLMESNMTTMSMSRSQDSIGFLEKMLSQVTDSLASMAKTSCTLFLQEISEELWKRFLKAKATKMMPFGMKQCMSTLDEMMLSPKIKNLENEMLSFFKSIVTMAKPKNEDTHKAMENDLNELTNTIKLKKKTKCTPILESRVKELRRRFETVKMYATDLTYMAEPCTSNSGEVELSSEMKLIETELEAVMKKNKTLTKSEMGTTLKGIENKMNSLRSSLRGMNKSSCTTALENTLELLSSQYKSMGALKEDHKEPAPEFSISEYRGNSDTAYALYHNKRPFDIKMAEMICEKNMRGHLAEVDDADELYFIVEFARKASPNSTVFYTGGNDIQKEGQFVYLGSGKPMVNTLWGRGQPGDSDTGDDCVTIDAKYGRLHDYPCNWVAPFICEMRVERDPKVVS